MACTCQLLTATACVVRRSRQQQQTAQKGWLAGTVLAGSLYMSVSVCGLVQHVQQSQEMAHLVNTYCGTLLPTMLFMCIYANRHARCWGHRSQGGGERGGGTA